MKVGDILKRGQVPVIAALKAPKTFIKKPIPRYMQANMSWLTKDKTTAKDFQSSYNEQSAKSRRSSIYPAKGFNRQRSEVSRIFQDGRDHFDFDEHDISHQPKVAV